MNIFNRVIVVIILIFLVSVSLFSIFNEFTGFIKWPDFALRIFNPQVDIPTYITVLALVAVFSISVILLLLEFYRRRAKVASISSSKKGNAMITLDTVAQQIRSEAMKVEGLEVIKVKIDPKATGIIINMRARLKENLDIPAKMQEIINGATGVVSDKLGIKVLKTNLTIVGFAAGKKEKEEEAEKVAEQAEDVSEVEDEKNNTEQDK